MSAQWGDGGPAFPIAPYEVTRKDAVESWTEQVEQSGMSLRDWFAGQALIGLITGVSVADVELGAAEAAYFLADAMLEARSRGRQS